MPARCAHGLRKTSAGDSGKAPGDSRAWRSAVLAPAGAAVTSGADLVGWRERIALPDLGISVISAKTDTGARTSAIHAGDIEPYLKGGAPWVRFLVHPRRKDSARVIECHAAVSDQRAVRNSGGTARRRYFVETTFVIGAHKFRTQLSLADRRQMGYRMLLGRTALRRRFLVDVSRSFAQGRPRISEAS